MRKRILALMLCLCMCMTGKPAGVLAWEVRTAEEDKIESVQPVFETGTDEGSEGIADNGTYQGVDWSLDADGHLTLVGNEGARCDKNAPWLDYNTSILSAEVKGSGWESLNSMFYGCSSLTDIDLSGLDTESATDMGYMFYYCSSLTSIDLSELNTGNVTNMGSMFYSCSSLTSIDLSVLDTGSVTAMDYMFNSCSSLTSIDLSVLNTENVTNMFGMLSGCSGLTSIDLSVLDTGNVTDMGFMLSGCRGLTSVDLSVLDTRNVTNMRDIFCECISLTSIILKGLDTGSVTDMSGMFWGCKSLTGIDLSGLDTENVTNMTNMFFECRKLEYIDLSVLSTGNVTDMDSMFYGCISLTGINLSGLDTGSVTNMCSMFKNCQSLAEIDLSGFNTENVGYMSEMFAGCSSLTDIDISGFKTGNLTAMGHMFSYCSSLESIDISGLNTENVWNMGSMFSYCNSLESIDISGLDMGSVTDMMCMFRGCSKLSTTVNFRQSPEKHVNYSDYFDAAATEPGSKIIVKYSGDCTEELARQIVETKSENSHVYLEGEEVTADAVILNKTELKLEKGESMQLIPTVTPTDAWEAYIWTSDNPSVAAVDEDGTVTGLSEGQAVIKIEVGSASAECTVKVEEEEVPITVTGIALNKTSITLTEKGATEQLTALVEPEEAANREVEWKSSDVSVATVSENGLVTAVGNGMSIVTVTTKDGNKTASCKVTVDVPEEPENPNPEEPENPENPNPEEPENPENPNPEEPENPENPNPEEPENPENPNPGEPENPENPENPNPEEPENPEDPNPEEPENPENPENPNPEEPENPENPNPENPEQPAVPIPGRIAGYSRYSTAIACAERMRSQLSSAAGGGKFSAAVVACADNFPDALAGSTLAAAVNAPILLVGKSSSGTEETLTYINENVKKDGTIYLLGGSSAIPEGTAEMLASYGFLPDHIKTLAGSSRYETNMQIVNEMEIEEGTDVVIVSGKTYADSLSVSGIAGAKGMPIFLAADTLSEEAAIKIKEIAPEHIYVIGGTAAVSDEVFQQAQKLCANGSTDSADSVIRIAGVSRYATSLETAKFFGMEKASAAVFACGGDFPDGLTGGAFAASLNAPVILVSDSNFMEQSEFLQNSSIEYTYVMGGTSVISDETMGYLMK